MARLIQLGFKEDSAGDDLARHVIDSCTDFGKEPYDGADSAWQDYLETFDFAALRGADVLRDIGIDAGMLVEFFRGEKSTVLELLRQARTDAKGAYESGKRPTPAQHVVHLLYATSRLFQDAVVCEQNIDFAVTVAKDKALITQLNNARGEAQRIKSASTLGRTLFQSFVEPMVARTVVDVLTGGGSAQVSFGSVTIRSGTVSVTVAENGTQPKQIAAYELKVAPPAGVTISIGPMIGMCGSCFQTVTEEVRPSAMAGEAETRVLRVDKQGFGIAMATLVNFPVVSYEWFQFGPSIGYPVSDIGGAWRAVLAGLNLGHRSGVSLGIGIHLFQARRLKAGYSEVIDTSEPGLAGLTAESVTRETYSASFFISLNISTGLLSRAGNFNGE